LGSHRDRPWVRYPESGPESARLDVSLSAVLRSGQVQNPYTRRLLSPRVVQRVSAQHAALDVTEVPDNVEWGGTLMTRIGHFGWTAS
jgi:hypothetical protein